MDRRCYHPVFDKKKEHSKACRCYRLKHSKYPLCSSHSRRVFTRSYYVLRLAINRTGLYIFDDIWDNIDSYLIPFLYKPCPYVRVSSTNRRITCIPCTSLPCMGSCGNTIQHQQRRKYFYKYRTDGHPVSSAFPADYWSADFWTIIENPAFPCQKTYHLYNNYYLKHKDWFDDNRQYIKS
jgi:hypothetical protein